MTHNFIEKKQQIFLTLFFVHFLDISSELIEPIIKGRELFASESRDIYPATFIK